MCVSTLRVNGTSFTSLRAGTRRAGGRACTCGCGCARGVGCGTDTVMGMGTSSCTRDTTEPCIAGHMGTGWGKV